MKKRSKLMSALLALCLIIGIIPITASAQDTEKEAPDTTWTDEGNYDTGWYDADTTKDVFEISSAEQLAGLAKLVTTRTEQKNFSGKTIKLTEDIDLSAHKWTRIGYDSFRAFSGTFDGGGHTITGMDSAIPCIPPSPGETFPDANYARGLFGYVKDGNIKNVVLKNPSVINADKAYTSAVVGYARGCDITNCKVIDGNISGGSQMGGIVGLSVGGTISDCTVTNTNINGQANYVGGIAGFFANDGKTTTGDSRIIDCTVTGGEVTGSAHVGGIAGANTDGSTSPYNYGDEIRGCYANTSVTGETTRIGGIVGRMQNAFPGDTVVTVSECISGSKVTQTGKAAGNDTVGGIVGFADRNVNIESCYSTGNIEGQTFVGGIAGINNGEIEACYSTGNIKSRGGELGGITGRTQYGMVKNCYSTGNVTGQEKVGGIVGQLYGDSVENCVALGESVEGTANVNRIVGKKSDGTIGGCYASETLELSTGKPSPVGEKTVNGETISAAGVAVNKTLFPADKWTLRTGYYPTLTVLEGEDKPDQLTKIPGEWFALTLKTKVDGTEETVTSDFKLKVQGSQEPAVDYTENLQLLNGTYDIYIGETDTGKDITGDGQAIVVDIDYYTVSFYDGDVKYGDDTPQKMQTILDGQKAVKPEVPVKTGYTFKGWKAKGEEAFWNFDKNTLDGKAVKLTAEWEKEGTAIPPGGDDQGDKPEQVKPDSDKSAETGDKSNNVLWFMIMIAAGVTILIFRRKTSAGR